MTFRELGLSAPILTALEEQGYTAPSPIQEKAIPPALAGRDVLGCAQTGTGKTCAFATPILQELTRREGRGRAIRALILTPTRELAIQIGDSFEAYGSHLSLRHTVIFGGVGQNPQVEALKGGVDILVATPGRLMDLYQQGFVSLEHLEIFVLDEADRMLDMGFIHDVKKILKWLPKKKQTLFFSATMPPEIRELVDSLLRDPVKVAVDPISSPVEVIRQSVYFVDRGNKTRLLVHLMDTLAVRSALVFTRTKHGANKVARDLEKGGIPAAAIHGNKSQTARQQALADFKAGKIRALVATDIAARGLDIEDLSHVFNYNLPEVPETYVHRIGRTGRAGKGGAAVSLCDFGEKPLLRDIEKLIGKGVPVVEEHPWPMEVFEAPLRDKNGRIINAEDAEARSAAREKHRARAQEKAAQEKERAELRAGEEERAPAGEESAPGRKRRRGKKKAQPEPAQSAPTPAPVGEQGPEEAPKRRKQLRPGARMDTGDQMPRTEFERPDPLAGDRIMDATARLLAPRRLTLQGEGRRGEGGESRRSRTREKKRAAGEEPRAREQRQSRESGDKRREERRGRERRENRRDRRPPEPPVRSHTKDSTEQKSLMKPYYLDVDR